MKILGINSALEWDAWDAKNFARVHDSGCTLFVDGKHVRSINEDRLSRVKYDGTFPYKGIEYCLGDIPKEDIDIVCYAPSCIKYCHEQTSSGQASDFFRNIFPNAQVWYVSHHLCHAASTVFSSPFNSGSFLTLDGMGSGVWDFADASVKLNENNSIGYFDKNKRIFQTFRLKSGPGENSFGDYYLELASAIYNKKTNFKYADRYSGAEGKIMGLSAYGSFDLDIDLPYTISKDFPQKGMKIDQYEFGEPIVNFYEYDHVIDFLKGYKLEDQSYYLQKHFENAMFRWMTLLREDYLTGDVCLAGGCFLNICANTLLRPLFDNIHIPPFTDDSGIAFGAAVWASYKSKERIEIPDNIALLGKSYDDYVPEEECEYFEDFDMLCELVAKYIDEDKIVAWFQGRSESGPRALGSRSILMSPKKKENKDIMNARVKHREYWRPFAGVVLSDRVGDYFEEGVDTPYMVFSQTVKSDKIPAITHEDNTCRIQTVDDKLNPRLCQLLRKFEDPILLNTSLNDNGEPIVETPEDAIIAFRNMDIDYLVIGNYLLWN